MENLADLVLSQVWELGPPARRCPERHRFFSNTDNPTHAIHFQRRGG